MNKCVHPSVKCDSDLQRILLLNVLKCEVNFTLISLSWINHNSAFEYALFTLKSYWKDVFQWYRKRGNTSPSCKSAQVWAVVYTHIKWVQECVLSSSIYGDFIVQLIFCQLTCKNSQETSFSKCFIHLSYLGTFVILKMICNIIAFFLFQMSIENHLSRRYINRWITDLHKTKNINYTSHSCSKYNAEDLVVSCFVNLVLCTWGFIVLLQAQLRFSLLTERGKQNDDFKNLMVGVLVFFSLCFKMNEFLNPFY